MAHSSGLLKSNSFYLVNFAKEKRKHLAEHVNFLRHYQLTLLIRPATYLALNFKSLFNLEDNSSSFSNKSLKADSTPKHVDKLSRGNMRRLVSTTAVDPLHAFKVISITIRELISNKLGFGNNLANSDKI